MSDEPSNLMAPIEPERLAPFDPPSDFVFPDWVNQPTPRALPLEWIDKQMRNKRVGAQFCFGIAVIFLVGAMLPITVEAAFYFLPLGYLHWGAFGLAVIGGLVLWTPVSTAAPHLQEALRGEPLIVRVERLARGPSLYMNGVPAAFHYLALISMPSPTGELEQAVVSRDVGDLKQTRCTYGAGDYVGAFRHRNRIQLYGFAGIDDREGIVAANGESRTSALTVVGVLVIVCLACLCFVLAFSTFRYFPLSVNGFMAVPVAIGGVIGIVWVALLFARARRITAAQAAINIQALQQRGVLEFGAQSSFQVSGLYGWFFKSILAFGAVALPVAICCLIALRLNVAFDQSTSHAEPIDDVRCMMTTTNFILRDYKVEFTRDGKSDSLTMTPQEMIPLVELQQATIRVRDGAFGWPWIERIEPRQWPGP
jgi:uncharacterized membrane protein